jgi:methylated-DNA-[protein]-cysteine S-methyltransferase
LPIRTIGNDFQKRVWKALLQIPFGETRSYLQLSESLGNPKAIRAVASANGANALSILIPCHRIIGSNVELTGYAGGLNAKKKLLELENPNLKNSQLDLF